MMMISLLEVFITTFLFFLVFQCFFLNKKSRDGPFINWPFLGMLPGLLVRIPRFFDWHVEALEAYDLTIAFEGPWFIGMDILLTVDPRNIRHILSSNFHNYHKGPEFKEIFSALGDGLLTADSELWEDLRKSNHTIFHRQDFLELAVSSTNSKLKKALFPFLDNASEGKFVIDLQDVFQRFIFEISSILMTGYDPMSLSTEMPKDEFSEAVEITEEAVFYRHIKPLVLWKLQNWIGIGIERKARDAMAIFDRMLAKIISSRREEIRLGEREPSVDVLTYYMNVDTSKYKLLKPKSDKFLRDVIFTLMLGGRDTTSSALTWFFWLLSTHPQVIAKIRQEISIKHDDADLDKLVYLRAALSESLRLYPSIPYNHKSPAESDVLPSGHKVEAHSKILISMYALGRMRSVWGEDASDFKPERWISDRGQLKHEPSYKFLAFSSGPRTCVGKNLALLLMKIIAVDIIRNYDFKIVEGQKIEPANSVVLNMKRGLKVMVSKRI